METLDQKISKRMEELENTKFPYQQELTFFKIVVENIDNNVEVISHNSKIEIKTNHINPIAMVIACYLIENKDANFKVIANEIKNQKKLILDYISELDTHFILKDFTFDLEFFKGTILSEERYQKALQRAFELIFYSAINVDLKFHFGKNINIINNLFQNDFDSYFMINETKTLITKKYKNLNKEYGQFEKRKTDEINSLKVILYNFKREQEKKIPASIDKQMMDNIEDLDIKQEIYKMIVSYNNNYFIEVFKENQKLKINSDVYIKYMFKMMGQNIDDIPDECMDLIRQFGSIDKISKILEVLRDSDYKIIDFYSKSGIMAFINTSSTNISFVSNLLKHGTISSDFVISNPLILYHKNTITNEDGLFSKLSKNYEQFIKNGFNICSPLNEALLMDNIDDFMTNFSQYGLNKTHPLPKEIKNKHFFTYIDLFIELGLNEYIKDNFFILNDHSEDIIKRIIIAKQMQLQIFGDNNNLLPSILTGNGFYVNNDNLDNFIISECSHMLDTQVALQAKQITWSTYDSDNNIKLLDAFKQSNNTYVIDNIIISRNKVLRYYNYLKQSTSLDEKELLKFSCLYNSILDIEDIHNISKTIDEVFEMKKAKVKNYTFN